jgi:hypothetical protein
MTREHQGNCETTEEYEQWDSCLVRKKARD